MAANLKNVGVACFGKRFVNQIGKTNSNPRDAASVSASALMSRRAVHISVYDKNPDDQARPSLIPENLINSGSDKYWAPHPHTGVFGPESEHTLIQGREQSFHSSPTDIGEEERAFFRPTSLEDLEKPL